MYIYEKDWFTQNAVHIEMKPVYVNDCLFTNPSYMYMSYVTRFPAC